MDRRETVLALVALGGAAGMRASLAQQQGRIWRVGFLSLTSASLGSKNADAFRKGMREQGYTEGRNLAIEWRYAEGNAERLPGLAAELVQLKVDVIVTASSSPIAAAQKATGTIPIVIARSADPVAGGFVKSLARPGGNITGLSTMAGDTGTKLVDVLRSVVPKLSRAGVLVNAGTTSRITAKSVEAGARKAGVKTLLAEASTVQEFENAFAMMVRERADALIVATSTFSALQQTQIVELALKYRMPSIGPTREYVEAGGLMSYGTKVTDLYQRSATYVDKILRGAKPGDLPIEQPLTLELVVNLKTARALGLTIPQSLLLRADDVIT